MTTIEIKNQIQKALEDVPENLLVDILKVLKQMKLEKDSNKNLIANLNKILLEDKELLHKLAQ